MTAVVAYATCADIPELEPDDRLTIEPLAARDVKVEAAIWDDPAVDWDRFDLVVLRSPWDYPPRRDAFVAWASRVPRLANEAATIAWNTDKRYLADLAATGVDTVPTEWVEPEQAWTAPPRGAWVIKPSISAGSRDTARYDVTDPAARARAQEHVDGLAAAGRTVMIQPYLDAVDTYGETGLVFIGGAYSHAIRKGPMLRGAVQDPSGLYFAEVITPREPSPAELALAVHALSVLPPQVNPSLYARVDVIPGPDGRPILIELELTEPSLFFQHGPGSADLFAEAIAAVV